MKKPIEVFGMDLKQWMKSPVAWVVMIILLLLPALFVWYDLTANKDPFQNTEHMKIGIVNEDQGTKIQNKKVYVGKAVERQLTSQKKWEWHVLDRQAADHALKKENYAAVLHIPQSFSKDVTGLIQNKPKQTTVTYRVNEKVNAMTPKLTDAMMGEAIKQADASFNQTVMKVLLDEANQQGLQLEDQLPSYQKIRDSIALANEALPKIEQFKQSVIALDQQQGELEQNIARLQQVDQYKNEAMAVNQQLNQIHQQNVATYGPILSGQAYEISVATGQLNQALTPLFDQYESVRNNLQNQQPGARQALSSLAQSLERDIPSVQGDIAKANQQFEDLDKDNTLEHIVKLMRIDLKKQAGVASNPIHLDRQSVYAPMSFQSGLTPFAMSIAIWLGLMFTMLWIPVRHPYEPEHTLTSTRTHFLGRFGIFSLITFLQLIVMVVTVLFILKVPMQQPLLFVAVSSYTALIYLIIIYSFVAVMGKLGKLLVFLGLIFQFVGTGGLFPLATAPHFVQMIQPYLPFNHSLMIFREAIGGIEYEVLVTETAWLGGFGLCVFLLGMLLYPFSQRQRIKRYEKGKGSKLFESSP